MKPDVARSGHAQSLVVVCVPIMSGQERSRAVSMGFAVMSGESSEARLWCEVFFYSVIFFKLWFRKISYWEVVDFKKWDVFFVSFIFRRIKICSGGHHFGVLHSALAFCNCLNGMRVLNIFF